MAQGAVCSSDLTKLKDNNALNTVTTSSPPNDYTTEDDPDNDQTEQDDDSETEEESDESFLEDMRKLERDFKDISRQYRLISKIGEGQRVYSSSKKDQVLRKNRNVLDRVQSRTAVPISRG